MRARGHDEADDAARLGPLREDEDGESAQGATATLVTLVPDAVNVWPGLFAPGPPRTVTVVICAYTDRRWDSLLRAIESLRAQRRPPDQYLVVIDHNQPLLQRARSSFPSDIDVVASVDPRGLSGARNAGVQHARGDVVAFLDDDAEADPGWLEELLGHYHPHVAGAGGVAVPVWPAPGRPPMVPA